MMSFMGRTRGRDPVKGDGVEVIGTTWRTLEIACGAAPKENTGSPDQPTRAMIR
jgi:hypothetical protein